MSAVALTPGQRHQLETLKPGMAQQLTVLLSVGATDSENAVDRRSSRRNGVIFSSDLDMSVLSRLAQHRGLAVSREKPAQYGIPRRRLYWLTVEGLAVAQAVAEGRS